jgi:hypothetical protein
MIPVAILLFLVGAVLACGFRVWILVPISLLAIITFVIVQLSHGANLPTALAFGLLIAATPQVGYAFGLFARNTLLVLRHRPGSRSSHRTSAETLYKRSVSPAP